MVINPTSFSHDQVRSLSTSFESAPLTDILRWAWDQFGTRAAIGTSFQGGGLVMIDHAVRAGLPFPIFTIDTQLLFAETYALKARLENFFGVKIESLFPEQTPEEQAAELGPELWKSKPDLCCSLRKVLPLQRKLGELSVWMTGMRRQQSGLRATTNILELYHFDVLRDRYILKLNPMAAWTRERVWDYMKERQIPYNPLQDQGYRSIGCWPCTRATGAGEDERAGRWTGFDKAECGIHTFLGESI